MEPFWLVPLKLPTANATINPAQAQQCLQCVIGYFHLWGCVSAKTSYVWGRQHASRAFLRIFCGKFTYRRRSSPSLGANIEILLTPSFRSSNTTQRAMTFSLRARRELLLPQVSLTVLSTEEWGSMRKMQSSQTGFQGGNVAITSEPFCDVFGADDLSFRFLSSCIPCI